MTELYERLYLPAIENGVDAVFFWDMTYSEIIAAIEGNQRRVKSEMQVQASLLYNLGRLLGYSFHEPKKYPKLHEAYPSLFEEVKDTPKQQHWAIMKERIEQYARERKKRGG